MEANEPKTTAREPSAEAARYQRQANQHASAGSLDEAEVCSREALRLFEALVGPVHPDVANVLSQLGAIYVARRQWSEAEKCVSRSVRITDDLAGIMAPTERNLLLVEDLALLGTALREMGRYGDAGHCLRRAVEVART